MDKDTHAVDCVEVGREAHQLELDYGRDAWKYARRFAERATGEGKADESAFWLAVSATLQPRN
jgi:hypothetical protein